MFGHEYAWSLIHQVSHDCLLSLSNEFYDLVGHIIETEDFSNRYACSRDIASTQREEVCFGIAITTMLYPLNDTCVRVYVKATRRGWFGGWKPGCGTLRQCASPSCFIDLVAYPSFSSSSVIQSCPLFVHSPSQPSLYNPLSFLLFLLSTFVRPPRMPPFLFCSAEFFVLARTSIITSSAASYLSNCRP